MSKSLMVLLDERNEIAESLATAENPVELMEQSEKAVQVKAAGIALYLDSCEEAVKQLDEKIKQLQARKKMFQGRIDGLKEYTYRAMTSHSLTKIDCPEVSISIAKNPIKVEVTDKRMIPLEFLVYREPDVDKKKIKEHFKKTGEIVDGVEIVQDESIRIR